MGFITARAIFAAIAFAPALWALGLTNPPLPNIDYAFAHCPVSGGLVMHGGWCEPGWAIRSNAWLLTMTGWEETIAGPRMTHHSAALDTHRNVVVVCGRTRFPNANTNVTWEFNGVAWQQKPDLLAGNGGDVELAYDRARRRIVAYVAEGTSETWEYDGTNWTKKTTATMPPALEDGALMTYDPVSNAVLLVVTTNDLWFSGSYASETWTYDGSDWTRRATGLPTNAWLGGLAWDEARGNAVLLTTDSETWTWNGAQWTRRTPAHSPAPARGFLTMAYDPLRAVSVFFSGEYSTGGFSQVHPIDTWEWDGADWQQFVPVPEPLTGMLLAAAGLLFTRARTQGSTA